MALATLVLKSEPFSEAARAGEDDLFEIIVPRTNRRKNLKVVMGREGAESA